MEVLNVLGFGIGSTIDSLCSSVSVGLTSCIGTSSSTVTYGGILPLGSVTVNGVSQCGTGITVTLGCPPPPPECVCFLPGTHIAVPGGERRVEELRAGDLVVTQQGAVARIKWVGSRTLDTTLLAQPELAMPVRITAGAIADGVPHRDLRVTPEHAVLVDGHLIPARLLVNGTTIRLDDVSRYTFHHVELDQHDILVAEGMGAESYLDTGNRALFANNGVVALHAGAPEHGADYNSLSCMALTTDPATTGRIWRALSDRATALGLAPAAAATTSEADLVVSVGGRRLRPIFAAAGRIGFALPAGAAQVTIGSRATMPWSVAAWLDDRRRLGVAIERIQVRGAEDLRDIALDSPALSGGWWDQETTDGRAFRWTNGAAELTLPVSTEPVTLELSVVASATHLLTQRPANDSAARPTASLALAS